MDTVFVNQLGHGLIYVIPLGHGLQRDGLVQVIGNQPPTVCLICGQPAPECCCLRGTAEPFWNQ